MTQNKFDIFVYADWKGMPEATLMGVLSAHFAMGKKAFSFEYDKTWLRTKQQQLLDPDIQFFPGAQFPNKKENFGLFLDSMPDTWGRTLMKRRAAQQAKERNEKAPVLYDIDYLLGVYDESRMGALRFKTDPRGMFLDNNGEKATPPWSSIRELQHAADSLEKDEDNNDAKTWLAILMAPGSSLGGARPKANITDETKELWIAKFPSKNDTLDKGAWEFLAYKLAIEAGVNMAPSKIEKIAGRYHTFFTKRFDREKGQRIHFASAMTMTGNNEDTIRDNPASYLDIADFIQTYGTNVEGNLRQLWRRIVFNIAISNTDDHLRNHGFILTDEGWILSPAYDLNPSIDKDALSLNIDMENNSLDFDLARSVGEFFRLDRKEMDTIFQDVVNSVSRWEKVADNLGISRNEKELMRGAFKV
ncbi:serine/threonine-protein kinase HipA [Chitinophaga terrae (ex Kim and Jung 2007)]|uniref:Serine/threonine-protein kinase HipA n=1 Tax=Chitinophaga terrae (ex Kim and Jung 2007) TaxID=408074 RepID=A0A1H4DRR4_9BACT|nr:HipA domain-containing protein [Chitinophaga terrae (ex Kim and Jung 2007)]GEP91095.1 toxin HipA [Chitinophaga terrae (ex Kim and Jung 2007)]SEA75256.1 serine/threonine-protein kinase HipA [Chitinophaga terrae (ex Kim and Jung 2007)]